MFPCCVTIKGQQSALIGHRFILSCLPAAGQVPLPPEPQVLSPNVVRVFWNPPQDPNGIIRNYIVNFVLLSTEPTSQGNLETQTQDVAEECVVGGVESIDRNFTVLGDVTSTTLEGLS